MRDDVAHPIDADRAPADVLVPVPARPQRRLRIVGMDGHQIRRADLLVELGHGQLESLDLGQVIARRERMTRIEANLDPVAADRLHHPPDLVERRTDAVAGTRVVLDAEPDVVRRVVQHLPHRLRDLGQRVVEAHPFVAADVKDHARHPQRRRQPHVRGERVDPLLQVLGVRRREVGQVDPVDEVRPHALRGGLLAERRDVRLGVCLPTPHLWRGAEDLHRLRAQLLGVVQRHIDVPRRGDVGADAGAVRGLTRLCWAHAVSISRSPRASPGSGAPPTRTPRPTDRPPPRPRPAPA